MRVLIVDDEIEIRNVIRLLLEGKGYAVCEAKNGGEAIDVVKTDADVDLCIMDIMMPKVSGISAAEEIRKFSSVPILFLTAKSLDADKEQAYTAGGDDYIVKPFSPRELLLKVEALTRRYNNYGVKAKSDSEISISGGIVIDTEHRAIRKNGDELDVRDKEYEVLLYLARNRGRTVELDELYKMVWNELPLSSSRNTITVHILNLRRKLEEDPSAPRVIRTVWGKGYQID